MTRPELRDEIYRLKAEVERMKMEESKLLTLCETYEGDLERLRKAGDAMYGELLICGDRMEFMGGMTRGMVGWNAAKEGK